MPVTAAQNRPLRVLPLGDSITAGIVGNGGEPSGGYRKLLEQLLAVAPHRAVLVGSRTDFSPGLTDPDHDGYPGYVIRATSPGAPGQLYGSLVRAAIERTHPDVILLMLGTNDFLRYEGSGGTYSVDTMVQSMDLLLGEIFQTAPRVHVILGAIVNSPKVDPCYVERFDTGRSTCDSGAHPSLAGLVSKYSREGRAISYAPGFFGVLPRDLKHFPDGIHPIAGPQGYDALAHLWYEAIERGAQTTADVKEPHLQR